MRGCRSEEEVRTRQSRLEREHRTFAFDVCGTRSPDLRLARQLPLAVLDSPLSFFVSGATKELTGGKPVSVAINVVTPESIPLKLKLARLSVDGYGTEYNHGKRLLKPPK